MQHKYYYYLWQISFKRLLSHKIGLTSIPDEYLDSSSINHVCSVGINSDPFCTWTYIYKHASENLHLIILNYIACLCFAVFICSKYSLPLITPSSHQTGNQCAWWNRVYRLYIYYYHDHVAWSHLSKMCNILQCLTAQHFFLD
jgi:hypothetical protein